MALVELTISVLLTRPGSWCRRGAVIALAFFVFLIALGYGWPAQGWEDFVKNRLGTLIMICLLAPLAIVPQRYPLAEAWRRLWPRR